jgi:hypothetical protein
MLRQRGMSQQAVPGSHNMMMSGLRTFALAFLLGGWSAVAAGAEPAPSLASLNSDLARLTLRQAEIFLAVAVCIGDLRCGHTARSQPYQNGWRISCD